MSNRNSRIESKSQPDSEKQKPVLLRPVPIYLFIILSLIIIFILYFNKRSESKTDKVSSEIGQKQLAKPEFKVIRQKDTSLINPLLFVENSTEEEIFIPVKAKINDYINQKKLEGTLTSASVYLNRLGTPGHTEINGEELYDPASIMKVPLMLIFLQHACENPEVLNKKLFFKKAFDKQFSASIVDKTITPGKSYSIEELIYSMIVYSDNEAFWLLATEVQDNEYVKLCSDFDIPLNVDTVQGRGQSFIANVNSISRFFRVLYNSSFLDRKMSRHALRLLTESKYKDGLLKGIDSNITVAHKFGERGIEGDRQFHEFAIVYLPENPYMIGVFTKGSDSKKLQGVLGDISKIVFDELKNKNPSEQNKTQASYK
jgi:beta-lactamase class A